MTPPLFRVEPGELDAHASTVVLEGPEGRHAATVRRVRAGELVEVGDGAGRLVRGAVRTVRGDRVEVAVAERVELAAARPWVVVVQALPKGDRGELAVETLTETGVDEVVPWAAARCVTRWQGARGERAQRRWASTAREAAKQSRRVRAPTVAPLASTPDVVVRLQAADVAVVLHEDATDPLPVTRASSVAEVVLVVGPEGGVSPEEVAVFTSAGAVTCRLGPTVLRTSTAGVVAAAVLLSAAGRWSVPRA